MIPTHTHTHTHTHTQSILQLVILAVGVHLLYYGMRKLQLYSVESPFLICVPRWKFNYTYMVCVFPVRCDFLVPSARCMYVCVCICVLCMSVCIMAQQLDGNRHTRRPMGAFNLCPARFYCSPNREFWEGNQIVS
jgi:hypothetical protein